MDYKEEFNKVVNEYIKKNLDTGRYSIGERSYYFGTEDFQIEMEVNWDFENCEADTNRGVKKWTELKEVQATDIYYISSNGEMVFVDIDPDINDYLELLEYNK